MLNDTDYLEVAAAGSNLAARALEFAHLRRRARRGDLPGTPATAAALGELTTAAVRAEGEARRLLEALTCQTEDTLR